MSRGQGPCVGAGWRSPRPRTRPASRPASACEPAHTRTSEAAASVELFKLSRLYKGLFPYYVISYNKQGSFQMITKDYSKGPRVVGKDYVLWKIQSMQESATMPHAHVFCCTPQC